MMKFSANLSMMFQEVPFMERFEAAAKAGFKAVEFMFPYEYPALQIKRELEKNQLKLVLFNLPPGNWAAGERGIAIAPNRQGEFREGVAEGIRYAQALGVTQMNCLVGKRLQDIPEASQYQSIVENLKYAADQFARVGCKLLIEPLNFRDVPGFCLNTTQQVLGLLEDVNRPNVYLQYDVYHAQRVEGELIGTLTKQIEKIAHIQIADNPGRHEPGTGEINYRAVLAVINQVGYEGYVGLEYIPDRDTMSSLEWIGEYGYSL